MWLIKQIDLMAFLRGEQDLPVDLYRMILANAIAVLGSVPTSKSSARTIFNCDFPNSKVTVFQS